MRGMAGSGWAYVLCAVLGCDDGAGGARQAGDAAVDADARVGDAGQGEDGAPDAGPPDGGARDCDDSRPPLVMMHGLLAAGDTFAPHVQRFAANGLCLDRYHAFDWASLVGQPHSHVGELDAFVDAVRALHGVETVDLMGHSAGGALGYAYLSDPARAAKVARYVHVASPPMDGPAGPDDAPVPTLQLWSADDTIIAGADIPGAQNVELPGQDHYAVATAPEAFEALYPFLYGEAPTVVQAPPAEPIVLSGKALVLADNTPEAGATIEMWTVGAGGQRTEAAPEASLVAAEDGAFGPFAAKPGQHYEFVVRPQREGAPPVRYYREPFRRTDPLVYLRTLPMPPSFAGTLLRQVPFDDAHTVLVVFNASRAVIAGVDSLTVDSVEMATEALASADATMIALFLYDVGADGASGGVVSAFGVFPFLSALDFFIGADPARSTRIELNGRVLEVPRWPSASEGAVIAVFD